MYHLMNRVDRREALFEDDQDRRRFLETWEELPKNGLNQGD